MATIIHDRSIFSERPTEGVTGTYCLGTADGESAFAPEIGVKVKSLYITGTDRRTRETVLRSILVGIASAYGAGEAEVAIAERAGSVNSLGAFGKVSIVGDYRACADGKSVAELVNAAYDETFRRMDILRRACALNVNDYNSRGSESMSKYFLVISDNDEDADEFIEKLTYIAYIGAAAGVYVVYASPAKASVEETAFAAKVHFVVSAKGGIYKSSDKLDEGELIFYGGGKEIERLGAIEYTDEELEAFAGYLKENEIRG